MRAAVATAALAATLAAAPAAADDVVVFAAASLSEALEEIGRTFTTATGHRVVFGFGASSDLSRQIRAGAPADVFFSADRAQMDLVERAGRVRAAERREVLSNSLVGIVPAASVLDLKAPADLARARRIALANPETVPAGVYARLYLQAAGLWPALAERVVPTLDVRAALSAVEGGHADAGIVYRTDAALSRRVRVVFEVPREAGPPIVYVLAPVADARSPAARAFVDEALSAASRRVYQAHGFAVLPP